MSGSQVPPTVFHSIRWVQPCMGLPQRKRLLQADYWTTGYLATQKPVWRILHWLQCHEYNPYEILIRRSAHRLGVSTRDHFQRFVLRKVSPSTLVKSDFLILLPDGLRSMLWTQL